MGIINQLITGGHHLVPRIRNTELQNHPVVSEKRTAKALDGTVVVLGILCETRLRVDR